jgi:hypothetical protein
MDLGLRDHVILVTGGAKGIDAQLAKALPAEGLFRSSLAIMRPKTPPLSGLAGIELSRWKLN